MKRKGSYLATLIDADYRREKYMKRKAERKLKKLSNNKTGIIKENTTRKE